MPFTTSAAMARRSASSPAQPPALAHCTMRALVGHREIAVQAGRDAAAAKGLLVDVHDLGLAQADRRRTVVQVERGQLAGADRGRRVDGRVDLDAGRHAQADEVGATARQTSRAVPSPPAKSSRPTPMSRRARAAATVSSAVVSGSAVGQGAAPAPSCAPITPGTTSGSKPQARASSSPISPGKVTISSCSRRRASRPRASAARPGASRTAPRSSACRTISAPSLPLRPTLPPTPATGLTIRPRRGRRGGDTATLA